MELAPQLPLAGTIVAKALFLQKAYPAAVKAAAAVSSPQAADALAIHGLAMLRAGDTANAAKVLTRLRELEPCRLCPLRSGTP
jgi:Flp pilus assembly protein TadD